MALKNTTIILGIDPGFADTGYGIIKCEGNKIATLDYGSIQTPVKQDYPTRIEFIYNEIVSLIKKYRPSNISIEELFFFKNVTTAIKVSQARGVVLLAAKQYSVKISEYTPLQIKQALTGYGRADKKQMQQMIKTVLGLKEIPRPDDAADALAAALCCSSNLKMERLSNKKHS